MFATILGWLGNLIGGPFAKAAVDAYRAKLSAENTSEKVAADLAARELSVEQREAELANQAVIAEQGRWYTALPRPFVCFRLCHLCVEGGRIRQSTGPRSYRPADRRRGAMGDDRAHGLFRRALNRESGADFGEEVKCPRLKRSRAPGEAGCDH
jgi:hypothetical protein